MLFWIDFALLSKSYVCSAFSQFGVFSLCQKRPSAYLFSIALRLWTELACFLVFYLILIVIIFILASFMEFRTCSTHFLQIVDLLLFLPFHASSIFFSLSLFGGGHSNLFHFRNISKKTGKSIPFTVGIVMMKLATPYFIACLCNFDFDWLILMILLVLIHVNPKYIAVIYGNERNM